jgi:hypothetical protein
MPATSRDSPLRFVEGLILLCQLAGRTGQPAAHRQHRAGRLADDAVGIEPGQAVGEHLRRLEAEHDHAGAAQHSVQLRVLGSRSLQDGDVGVGVFPECEEIVVSRSGTSTGSLGLGSL